MPSPRSRRFVNQRVYAFRANPQVAEAPGHWPAKFIGKRVALPVFGGHALSMDVDLVEELLTHQPAPADSGVHHLDQVAMSPPRQDKMGEAIRLANHHNGRQRPRLRHEQVVHRNHDLFRLQPHLPGHCFQNVN
jgi:hypothetical protein